MQIISQINDANRGIGELLLLLSLVEIWYFIRFALSLSYRCADTLIHLYGLRWKGGDDIVEKRLLSALFLTFWNFATFNVSLRQSNGRCSWVCFYRTIIVSVRFLQVWFGGIYISAWASALLVLRYRAMRRPQSAGRVTVQIPSRLICNRPSQSIRVCAPIECVSAIVHEKRVYLCFRETNISGAFALISVACFIL